MSKHSLSAPQLYSLLGLRAFLFSLGPVGYVTLIKNGADPYATIAYILITGGIITLGMSLKSKNSSQTVQQLPEIGRELQLVVISLLSIFAPTYYILYALAMQQDTIVGTTIMARTSILLAFPLSIIFLRTKVLSWKNMFIGYSAIIAAVIIFKLSEYSNLFNQTVLSLLTGVAIAVIGASQDCAGTFLSKRSKLAIGRYTGWSLLIGGIGLQLILVTFQQTTWFVPTLAQLAGICFLGFFTIGIPGIISAMAGRDLAQPILVSASTLTGLIFTAILSYLLHNQTVSIFQFIVTSLLLGTGFLMIKKSEGTYK